MQKRDGNNEPGKPGEPTNLASDAEIAQERNPAEDHEDEIRIRPINVFELARRVYSSKKTSPRRHRTKSII